MGLPNLSNSNSKSLSFNASRASQDDRRMIWNVWRREAKASSRMELLTSLEREGKALKDVVKVGQRVEKQKHSERGDCDWELVRQIMGSKLRGAKSEVRKLKREQCLIKESIKKEGPECKLINTVERAESERERYMKNKSRRNQVKIERIPDKKEDELPQEVT